MRKVPATPAMLSWIRRYLDQSSMAACERAATWAAICTGWFFMLRASEYLPPPDPAQASRRVIRGCDLTFYQEGVTTTLFQASSVSVQLRESKTDQFQRGQIRTHHHTGEEICPVKALQAHGRENPGWLNDPAAVVFQYQGVGITPSLRWRKVFQRI